MCSELDQTLSIAALIVLFLSLCLFMHRIQKHFAPRSLCFMVLSVFLLISNSIFLVFQMSSTCRVNFITYGSVTFALFFCLSLVETCTYVFDVTF